MSATRRTTKTRRVWIAAAMTISTIAAPTPAPRLEAADDEVVPTNVAPVEAASDRPHVLRGAVADVLVRLYGGACSGTPITGTVFVVTAAHCVLTDSGEVTRRTVVRDGIRYPAAGVLVDPGYLDHPSAARDAAVLVMAQVIPGPSARLGSAFPASGQATLAGYQEMYSDGTLSYERHANDQALSIDAAETTERRFEPAGCVVPVNALDVSATRVMTPCGLVPGASGGGLYTERDGEIVLAGILSTVTADLTTNGVVPLASLHELLQHPERHWQSFSTEQRRHEQLLRELR